MWKKYFCIKILHLFICGAAGDKWSQTHECQTYSNPRCHT